METGSGRHLVHALSTVDRSSALNGRGCVLDHRDLGVGQRLEVKVQRFKRGGLGLQNNSNITIIGFVMVKKIIIFLETSISLMCSGYQPIHGENN